MCNGEEKKKTTCELKRCRNFVQRKKRIKKNETRTTSNPDFMQLQDAVCHETTSSLLQSSAILIGIICGMVWTLNKLQGTILQGNQVMHYGVSLSSPPFFQSRLDSYSAFAFLRASISLSAATLRTWKTDDADSWAARMAAMAALYRAWTCWWGVGVTWAG